MISHRLNGTLIRRIIYYTEEVEHDNKSDSNWYYFKSNYIINFMLGSYGYRWTVFYKEGIKNNK